MKHNVGIITVIYSTNCGSVLQALALQDAYSNLGCNVSFISTINKLSALSYKKEFKDVIKALVSRSSPGAVMKKYRDSRQFIREHFHIVDPSGAERFDLLSIGSDTVWDVTSPYFLESQDVFWGLPWDGSKIVTYAASIANSPYETLDSLEYPCESIKKYANISVRDDYTFEYITSRTDRMPCKVCDPTLLKDRSFYQGFCGSMEEAGNYLLLYLFDTPSAAMVDEIKQYAADNSLKIVSLGRSMPFADMHYESTVVSFLSCFNGASAVVTNTFHGTVFSLIFHKPFVVLDYQKKKIENLLHDLALDQRIVGAGIEAVLNEHIDYTSVESKFSELRANSISYLEKCVQD